MAQNRVPKPPPLWHFWKHELKGVVHKQALLSEPQSMPSTQARLLRLPDLWADWEARQSFVTLVVPCSQTMHANKTIVLQSAPNQSLSFLRKKRLM